MQSGRSDQYYRLPTATCEAVLDGKVTLIEWAIFVWLASHADYQSGIVRTCATILSVECKISPHKARRAIRKLKSVGWICYDDTRGVRGSYPIGIHGYRLPDGGFTPTAKEWKDWKADRSAAKTPHDFAHHWYSFNEADAKRQLIICPPERTSSCASYPRPAAAKKVTRNTRTNAEPESVIFEEGCTSSCASPCAPSSPESPMPEAGVDQINIHNDTHTNPCASGIHSRPIDWMIWGEYERQYKKHCKMNVSPIHSTKDLKDNVFKVRTLLEGLRVDGVTQDEIMELYSDSLKKYFEQNDGFVRKADWNLATFVHRLPGILKEMRAELAR